MRQIKFRGLAKANDKHNNIKVGDWVYGSFIENDIDAPCIIFDHGEQMEIDKKSLGQLTGLKDKNSTLIYEGDILLCTSEYQGIESVLPVDMDDTRYTYPFCNQLNFEGKTYSDHYSVFEVIGNIHKNPELLGE